MRLEVLQGLVLAVAQERRIADVLARVGAVLAAQPGVALARVWLIEPGDVCARCDLRAECADQSRCLHLVASAGNPSVPGESWNGLDGAFARFPLGVRKVGKVGATGSGILLHDMSERSAWIVRPQWAAREGIRSFAAHPLAFRGEVLGVVAVFSRTRIDAEAFASLRAFADHAAVAIAHARAFEEVDRRRARLEVENRVLRQQAAGGELVGASPALAKVLEQVELVAPTAVPVLILGEPGTGKTLVARRVHARSPRCDRPFIAVDCAAGDRLVRELFDDGGPIHAAEGGTLFLDEVAQVPLDLQGRLQELLQEQPVRVRVVAASNRDLPAAVAARRFREDLHHRLSVFPIHVPPLRDRPGDVVPLVEHFLRGASARVGRPRLVPSARDLRLLERHAWPGNVRELASTVEQAVLLARDGHVRFDVPGGAAEPGADPIPVLQWRDRERANVEAALARAGGRIYGRGGAAEMLGVPPTTLVSRVKALRIARRPVP